MYTLNINRRSFIYLNYLNPDIVRDIPEKKKKMGSQAGTFLPPPPSPKLLYIDIRPTLSHIKYQPVYTIPPK